MIAELPNQRVEMRSHNNQYLSHLPIRVLILLISIFAVSFLLAPKVSAGAYPKLGGDGATQNAISSKTGNWYPGQYDSGPNQGKWYNNSNDGYNCAWGSHWNANGSIPDQDSGACATGLPAGTTRYKLFMQDTGNPITTDAWLRGACKGDTANGTTPYKKKIEPNGQPDNPNKGDRRINVTVKQPQSGAAKYSTNNHNAGDCVGDDLRVTVPGGSNGAFTKQARYGGGVYTAVIEIEKVTQGQQMFRLEWAFGEIFGDEDTSFALGNRRKGSYSSYEFIFKTDCSYRQDKDYSFNIHDIDWGELQRPNNPIKIILVPIPFASTPENVIGELLPASGQYKLTAGTLKANTAYRLNFTNIEDNNGIRFDLPFSEYQSADTCLPPPTPPPTSACDLLTFNMGLPSGSANNNIPGTTVNPPRRHFAVYVNDGSSAGVPGAISNPSGPGNTVQPAANSPNTYNTGTYNWVPPLKGPVDYNSRDYFGSGIDENRNIRINLKNGRIAVLDGNTEVSSANTNRPALKSGPLEYTVVIYNIYQKPSPPQAGDDRINIWYRQTFNSGNTPALANCYQASCSVDIVENVPGAPNGSNAIRADSQQFPAIMRVHNNSSHRLPIRIGNAPLGLTNGGGNWNIGTSYNNPVWHGLDPDWMTNGIPQGQSATATVYLNLDDIQRTVGVQQLVPYPDYYGVLRIGASCPTSVNVYKEYEARITPSVDLTPTREDPSQVIFQSTLNWIRNPGVGVNIHHNMLSQRDVVTLNSQNGTVTVPANVPATVSWTHVPAPVSAGTNFCVYIYSNQGYGWVGPGGNILGAQRRPLSITPPNDTYYACSPVYDAPYLSVYGGDAIAGSSFKTGLDCSPAAGGQQISTFRSSVAGKAGSSVQYAAMALGQISGFMSSSLRSPATGLSFANTALGSSQGVDRPGDGGFFNGDRICATDFFGKKQNTTVRTNNVIDIQDNSLLENNKSTEINPAGGTVRITNSNPANFPKNVTIYVNGNAVISSNIAYEMGKKFELIVSGNIYIEKDVTRLDGLYVAQPNGGSGGNIYTCALGTALYDATAPLGPSPQFANCSQQLTINGAFVAKSVKFLRVFKSLRDSRLGEVVPGMPGGSQNTNAAEVFNFSPELYMFPGGAVDPLGGQDDYDFITTLPPVL